MPVQTDQTGFPYFDDHQPSKDFAKFLFKPGTSVQVRELNQLQTLFQQQIERFGDNVFKQGTIVDGCNFMFDSSYPFVKIKDLQLDGQLVDVDRYRELFARNSANLVSRVTNAVLGYESSSPDLNTLFVKYLNSGTSGSDQAYANNDVLTIFDGNNSIQSFTVVNGGSGFSNSDNVVVVSALALQNSTGGTILSNTFVVGEMITQTTTGAQAIVVNANTTANTQCVLLEIKPLANNLGGSNTLAWTFDKGLSITSNTSGIVANVNHLVGAGAVATITTEGISGTITKVNMIRSGEDYYHIPQVAVRSSTGTVSTANIVAQNYLAKVTVDSVGHGYGFSITDGIIYQKGYFSRVSSQQVIVSKYSNTPHDVVIGFSTTEAIVNSAADSSLFDNVTGSYNSKAPGADRLKLTPKLVVLDKAESQANDQFLSIVEFSEGKAFKQNFSTQYDKINDEIARRTHEESGNYVIDPFYIGTKSSANLVAEANTFNVVVDPGIAYINGYRVVSAADYTSIAFKGTTTGTAKQTAVSIDYGNYIIVNELSGNFDSSLGQLVDLHGTARQMVSTGGFTVPSAAGSTLGTARIRAVSFISGEAGTPSARYKIYLFDIRMNTGSNFRSVRSLFFNGTVKAVADVVLNVDGTTGQSIALIKEPSKSSLLSFAGISAVKQISNTSYIYRSVDHTLTANTEGNISKVISSPESFPYVGTLSDNEKEELIVVPLANLSSSNSTGTVATTSGQSNVIGTGTTFVSDYQTGDYITVANSSAVAIKMITSISNNTLLTVSNTFSGSFASATTKLTFPQYVPISLSTRSDRVAIVTANTTLTIDLGVPLEASGTVSVTYNVRTTANPVSKTTKRKNYIKIQANTHSTTVNGPWCLGVPDIFRLRNVYVGDGSVNTSSTKVTNEFYIDHNQNDDYLGVGYLYKKPLSSYTIGANDVLLIEYDVHTRSSEGLVTVDSYSIDDTLTLAQADVSASDSTIHTVELSEVWGNRGNYYDLRDQFDFRPTSNSALITSTVGSAPINPTEPSEITRFGTSNKKFPAPQSDITFDVEYYQGRNDRVIVNSNGDFKVVQGVPGVGKLDYPPEPENSLTITSLTIPPYPTLPTSLSQDMIELADTSIANQKYANQRLTTYRVKTLSHEQSLNNQPRRYTMSDIGALDKRIQNLEYYTSLNSIETQIRDKVIPSSVDPASNRFKFGFFVDNFENEAFADINNPAYNATIFNSQLGPRKENLILKFRYNMDDAATAGLVNGSKLNLPYTERTIISQLNATDPCNAVDDITILAYVQVTGTVDILNKNTSYNDEVNSFKLSETGGPANIIFDLYSGSDRIEIHQSTTSTFTYSDSTKVKTTEDAVVLTSTERTNLSASRAQLGSQNNVDWSLSARPDFTYVAEGGNPKYWTRGAGKIAWTHDPSKGQYYKIVVKKNSTHHGYRMTYPTDIVQGTLGSSCNPPTATPPSRFDGLFVLRTPEVFRLQGITNKKFMAYTGWQGCTTCQRNVPAGLIWDGTNWYNPSYYQGKGEVTKEWVAYLGYAFYLNTYSISEQKFRFKVIGLKPNTTHFFNLEGTNKTSKCQQVGKLYGGGLTSNATGELEFDFYFSSDITGPITSYSALQNELNRLAGIKQIVITSGDYSSYASYHIGFIADPSGMFMDKEQIKNTTGSTSPIGSLYNFDWFNFTIDLSSWTGGINL